MEAVDNEFTVRPDIRELSSVAFNTADAAPFGPTSIASPDALFRVVLVRFTVFVPPRTTIPSPLDVRVALERLTEAAVAVAAASIQIPVAAAPVTETVPFCKVRSPPSTVRKPSAVGPPIVRFDVPRKLTEPPFDTSRPVASVAAVIESEALPLTVITPPEPAPAATALPEVETAVPVILLIVTWLLA
nr:hypothetical protein [Bosea thiooxidans]